MDDAKRQRLGDLSVQVQVLRSKMVDKTLTQRELQVALTDLYSLLAETIDIVLEG